MKKILIVFIILLYFQNQQAQSVDPLASKDLESQNKWVDSIYNKLSIDEKIGQLFFVQATGNKTNNSEKIVSDIKNFKIGGLIFSTGDPTTQAHLTNKFQNLSSTPLLISMDAEWGIGMRLDSVPKFPWNMSLGAVTDDLIIETGGSESIRVSSAGKIGIDTSSPRATLDVEGDTRLKSYHEAPVTLTSSGQVVNIDLSKGQTFELTTTENIVEFRISNFVADMATSFTIKILQGSTARTVDIDDFKNSAGSASIPVNWPGGVVPTVTASAGAVDIYSFMTFDGGDRLYGVVGGQNFL